ncbi:MULTISPECIES: ABC transporter permease [unclassified Xanthomonas]|uniref:ABC transporter permease n=1 Tax=unclassified Xanthomonas TaxID=2643310 RepID=UPI001619AF38|nr:MULTISPECIES: ABC transporter permease [unclassified Xanthomonas]MBB5940457.1 putative ABC transport system permease protein [Xanthomonas sp. 3307]
MFGYYFHLGLRSLMRNPVLTGLMVLSIAVGVAASMTTYAVFRATSSNPIPEKSAQLFVAQIDNWGPTENIENGGEPPRALSYKDTIALMRDHRAMRQTALYPIKASIVPADMALLPFQVSSYATYSDAFPMFGVPFLYGGGWSAAEDESRAAVAVISRSLNDSLFKGANSVGKEINIDGRSYRIRGVMDRWNPQPLFYDAANTGGFDKPAQLFIPFTHAISLQLPTNGNRSCYKTPGAGWEAWLQSECAWIAYWVELPDKASAESYLNYLRNYSAQQQQSGRFNWPPNARLRDVAQWLDYLKIVPPESKISALLGLGFLLICLVNTIGLLLAKFMRRAAEIGIRRALGAPRSAIYMQFLVEAGTVGLAGGVLGLLLTGLGMLGTDLVFEPEIARLAELNVSLAALTLVVATLATVIAALYPIWRAAQVQPAWQLKAN